MPPRTEVRYCRILKQVVAWETLTGKRSRPAAFGNCALEVYMDLSKNRNLFNGDFGCLFWNAEMWQPDGGPYSAGAIHRFVDNLADNGVDTFTINPNTKVAWYPSKVVPTILDGYVRNDPAFFEGANKNCNWFCPGFVNPYLDLAEAGVDWLAEAIKACRRRGLAAWISVRMNDPHNSPDPADPMNAPQLLDPRLQLGGRSAYPESRYDMGTWGLNYACPEVRDYMFTMIGELVEDYDAQGLQLDWLRIPACCPPGASQATVDMMTDWFLRIRELTEAKANQTATPFPLGMRVPGNYRMLRHLGIDVAVLVEERVLDFLCPSNFMQTSWDMPHDQLREELGGEIAIYGVTELWINCLWSHFGTDADRYNCAHPAALRGNAAGKLALGADGIEHFNFFVGDLARKYDGLDVSSQYDVLRGLADTEALRGREKHYTLTTVGRHCWVPPFDLPDSLPVVLAPQWRRAFRLPMCAEPADSHLELVIQVVVAKENGSHDIGVSFNGCWPRFDGELSTELLFPDRLHSCHVPEHQAYNFLSDVGEIREGWNEIVVLNSASEAETPAANREHTFKIVGLELAVRRCP